MEAVVSVISPSNIFHNTRELKIGEYHSPEAKKREFHTFHFLVEVLKSTFTKFCRNREI